MPDLKTILENAKTIAVVGCSDNPARTSHGIAGYLQNHDYRIIPVNPNIEVCHGETAYPDLESLPEDIEIDIVDVFRNARYAADMVRMAARYAEATGTKPVLWMQLGVSTEEARQLAEEAGLPYVEGHCIKVAHARLVR